MERRIEINGEKYSLVGGRLFTSNGKEITDKTEKAILLSQVGKSTLKPVGADNLHTDAANVIDNQEFEEIEGETQSAINKSIDENLAEKSEAISENKKEIDLLKNQGGDRGFVLCAYTSSATIQSVNGAPTIKSVGSNYKANDVLFINIQAETVFIKAWAIIKSVDSNGGITAFDLNTEGKISSVGAYKNVVATIDLNTFTSGNGSGAVVDIALSTLPGSSSNIASVQNPKPGNTVLVLQDETANNDMWKYIFADRNGDGIFNWIPLQKVDSLPLVADGKIMKIDNGVITTDNAELADFCEEHGNITYKPLTGVNEIANMEVITLDNQHLEYTITTVEQVSITFEDNGNSVDIYVDPATGNVKKGNDKVTSRWSYIPVKNSDGTDKKINGYTVYNIQNVDTSKYIVLDQQVVVIGGGPWKYRKIKTVDSVALDNIDAQFILFDESYIVNGRHRIVNIAGYNGGDLAQELDKKRLYVFGDLIGLGFDIPELDQDQAIACVTDGIQSGNSYFSLRNDNKDCKIITKKYVVVNKVIDTPAEGTIIIDGSVRNSEHTKILLYVMPVDVQYNQKIAVKCLGKGKQEILWDDYDCDKGYKFYYLSYEDKTFEVVNFGDRKQKSDIFENNVVEEEFNMKFDDVLNVYIDQVKQIELGQYGIEVADHSGNLLLHSSKSDTKIYDGEGNLMMGHEGVHPGDTFLLITGLASLYSAGNRLTINNNCVVPAYKIVEFTLEEYNQITSDNLLYDYFQKNPTVRISVNSHVFDDPSIPKDVALSYDNGFYSSLATVDFNLPLELRKYVMINSLFVRESIYGWRNKIKLYHLIDLMANPTSEVNIKSIFIQLESNKKSTYFTMYLYGMPVFHVERLWNGRCSLSLIGQNGYTNFGAYINGNSDLYTPNYSYYNIGALSNNSHGSSNYIYFYPPSITKYFTPIPNNQIWYTKIALLGYRFDLVTGTGKDIANVSCIEDSTQYARYTKDGSYSYRTWKFSSDVTKIKRNFMFDIGLYFYSDLQTIVYLPDSVDTIEDLAFGEYSEGGSAYSTVFGVYANNIKHIGYRSFGGKIKFLQLHKDLDYLPQWCIGSIYYDVEVFYGGTLADFDAIPKHSNWKYGTYTVYVNATDGRKAY